jgi:hypothetical protein
MQTRHLVKESRRLRGEVQLLLRASMQLVSGMAQSMNRSRENWQKSQAAVGH